MNPTQIVSAFAHAHTFAPALDPMEDVVLTFARCSFSSKPLAHRLDFDAEQPPAKRMKMGPPSRPARIPHSSIMRLLPSAVLVAAASLSLYRHLAPSSTCRSLHRRLAPSSTSSRSLYRRLAPSSTCRSLYRRLAPSSSPSSSSSSISTRRSTKTSRRRSPVGMSAATGR
ncbi:hypothetical protein B0H13DRAFT_2283250, partial [Mycena leptocephala]